MTVSLAERNVLIGGEPGACEHPKVVQELLGHSSISMTRDLYSRVTDVLRSGAAATMDRLFDR